MKREAQRGFFGRFGAGLPRDESDSYWISTITQTDYAKRYFFLRSKQSTNLASISATNIKKLPVLIPPRRERAAILDRISRETGQIDTLIAKVREHIAKLREFRTALISAAVTGKVDVRDAVA